MVVQSPAAPTASTPKVPSTKSSIRMSPYEFAPLPQAPPRATTSRKRSLQSTVLTGTPHKKAVKETQEKAGKYKKVGITKTKQSKQSTCVSKRLSFTSELKSHKQNLKKRSRTPKTSNVSSSTEDTTPCCVCGRCFNQPPADSWTQCPKCHKWFHDSCGPGDTTMCYFCLG